MSGTPIVPSVTDSQKKQNRIIAWVTGLLTLTVAIFAFILSFTSLADMAVRHGVSIPVLFPLIVEAGVVIFSLNALYRSIQGESAKWQWCLIISSSLMAGTFNVLHAETNWISRFVAAMPSLFLLLSFETFLGQIKYAVRKSGAIFTLGQVQMEIKNQRAAWETEAATKRSELEKLVEQTHQRVEDLQKKLDALSREREKLRSEIALLSPEKLNAQAYSLDDLNTRAASKRQAQLALLDFYERHPNASMSDAGKAINRSKSTVSDYLDELKSAGQIIRNGKTWEVLDKWIVLAK